LAARWLPILNAFEEAGVDLCFEIHPGEDLHDGVTFEMFLERVKNHPRCNMLFDPSHFVLQQLDYLQFIDLYHPRIKMFHVKDAEFNSSARQGVYGGYQPWIGRAGGFALWVTAVDFAGIFPNSAIRFCGLGCDRWDAV
jgi:sugar phosphate isomerase/epimerase